MKPDELRTILRGPEGENRLLWRKGSGPTVEIYDICVHTGRREGSGTQLVQELLSSLPPEINTVWAFTRASNLVAQQFYLSLGFAQAAYVERFYCNRDYKDGDDWETADAILFTLNVRSRA